MHHKVFCAECRRRFNGPLNKVTVRLSGSVSVGVGDSCFVRVRFKAACPVKIIICKEGRAVKDPVIKAHIDAVITESGKAVNGFCGVIAHFKNIGGCHDSRFHADNGGALK